MPFLTLNRYFATVADLAAYLASIPKPPWRPIGSTYHNTYRPTEAQWRGLASLQSMQATYEAKGWSTGPHLYLAAGTPADGIFAMCPLVEPAIHGVTCNKDRFGIEVVGDFQTRPMSPAQLSLLIETLAALHRWAGIGPDINAHRDCVERTCPGDAAYAQKAEIQRRLAERLATSPAAYILGPHNERFVCDVDFAQFYKQQNGLWNFGFALDSQRSFEGRAVVRCERAILSREPGSGLVRPLLTSDQLRILL